MIIAEGPKKVIENTPSEASLRIEDDIRRRLHRLAGKPDEIAERLAALDDEWDIERCLETTASSLVVLGTMLGIASSRKWFALPALVGGFLLQHAVQGWCPPLPVLRSLGVRTADEINRERYALKSLRGDFERAVLDKSTEQAERVFSAVQSAG